MVQLSFNLLRWAARRTILPKLASLGIGIVCREPLYYGYLTGRFTEDTVFDRKTDVRSTWPRDRHLSLVAAARRFNFLHEELGCSPAQAALAYCLNRPEISTVIMGIMTVAELNENLLALDLTIEPDMLHNVVKLQESNDVNF